jgi:hypothetical protein
MGLFNLLKFWQTYTIPLESFKQQFKGLDISKEVATCGPVGDIVTYKTYPIDIIKCIDKKGNPVELKNSPALEIRFTDVRNKKIIFYFDLLQVDEISVTGDRSRLIRSKKTILINDITKIEIQNGRKLFRYVN